MSNRNTVRRAIFTICILLLLAHPTYAQSLLNFAAVSSAAANTGLAITNPNPYYADVQLTLYGADGNPVSGLAANPVAYRIGPHAQLAMSASQIFAASMTIGWIQATSNMSGLAGYYFSGDYSSTLQGSPASAAFSNQALTFVRDDLNANTNVLIVNSGTAAANVTVTFFSAKGQEINTVVQGVPAHGLYQVPLSTVMPITNSSGATAQISSSQPVIGMAVTSAASTLLFQNGQATDQPASTRVIPDFITGNGAQSILWLANPTSNAANVKVTLYSGTGGSVQPSLPGPSTYSVTIPPHASASLDSYLITGLPIAPSIDGWLRIDSDNIPLDALTMVSSTATTTIEAAESTPQNVFVLSRVVQGGSLYFSQLNFSNPLTRAVSLTLTLLKSDGTTVNAIAGLSIPALSKIQGNVEQMIPQAAGMTDGFVLVQASDPIYSVELMGSPSGSYLATVDTVVPSVPFVPDSVLYLPAITQVATDVQPGTTIQVSGQYIGNDAVGFLGSIQVNVHIFATGSVSTLTVDIPANAEVGYANLRLRSGGVDTSPVLLHVLAANSQNLQTISGWAFYQKIPVDEGGLELTEPVMVPIRNARVEVRDSATQTLISASETDPYGNFLAAVPGQSPVSIQVLSLIRYTGLQVEDNTNGNVLYPISTTFDPRNEESSVLIRDTSRVSGAFNILEMVERGNDLVHIANRAVVPPAPTIFWSTNNTTTSGNIAAGQIGTTYFDLASNSAYVLGDRNVDSDEYDDSVIIHEYAHMLASAFSRDDSPGGPHFLGDILDPRVAWSEGWADFFSCAARNDSLFIDSSGPNGTKVMSFDIEINVPAGDNPGYWSEASVDGLLWDLFDNRPDAGDDGQYPIGEIWTAFTDLVNSSYVYLPDYLDWFVATVPSSATSIQAMAQIRSIDYNPGASPSVSNPFPQPMNVGDVITGAWVDSYTPKRTNLAQSSHFFTFTTTGGATIIRMDITGLGPGNNPNFNDLDIFLTDAKGTLVNESDRGLNGQSELISMTLPAGTYVVEVRSFYQNQQTGQTIYNSGQFKLSVLALQPD